jgi:hypothetical protein
MSSCSPDARAHKVCERTAEAWRARRGRGESAVLLSVSAALCLADRTDPKPLLGHARVVTLSKAATQARAEYCTLAAIDLGIARIGFPGGLEPGLSIAEPAAGTDVMIGATAVTQGRGGGG